MANKQYNEDSIRAIANAIRARNGKTDVYRVRDMAAAINSLSDIKQSEYSFSQQRDEVSNFLSNTVYDPTDYTTSSVADYVTQTTSNYPVGCEINIAEAGTLTVVDGNTGRSFSGYMRPGPHVIYNCTPNCRSHFYVTDDDGAVIQTGFIAPTGSCRMIYIPNVKNVRDLGGWNCDGGTVKYGLLYRGGEPYSQLTDDSKNQCVKFLGIQKEINLVFASDLGSRTESGFGHEVDMLHVDMTWNDLSYQKFSGNIKAIMEPFIDYVIAGKPTYFHCSMGADRTGVVALLCEAILGISQSDIDKDYELTNFYSGVSTDSDARRRNETVWTREINYINTYSGNTFRDRAVSLLVSCGITIDKINSFRAAMTDGTPDALTADINSYSISKTISNITTDNSLTSIDQYQSIIANLTPSSGYVIDSIKVTMGGEDITCNAFSGHQTVLRRSVVQNLTNFTSSNARCYAIDGQSYVSTLTQGSNTTLQSLQITMGGIDVSKYYSNGTISIPEVTGDIVITATAVKQAATYKNLLDSAIDMSGNVVGHTPMYSNMRWNSSSGDPVAISGYNITGLIPCKPGDTVRIRWGGKQDEIYQQIKGFTSNKTQVTTGYMNFQNLLKGSSGNLTSNVITSDIANGKFDFTFKNGGNVQLIGMEYIAISLYGSLDNVIVTVNEEID